VDELQRPPNSTFLMLFLDRAYRLFMHRAASMMTQGENAMTMLIKSLAAVAAGTVLATSAFAQSVREVRSPLIAIENEPAPKLVVEPPLPGPLARGAVLIPYRVENLRILPVLGAGALNTLILSMVGGCHDNCGRKLQSAAGRSPPL
jgi:hypothetical protein